MTTNRHLIELLLRNLDQAFDRKSWHGTNLRGSIRGLEPARVVWRPGPGRHCIADLVLHTAYWKYTVRRRLCGDKRGSFPLKGSNWFKIPDQLEASEWQRYVRLLEEEHRALREAIAVLTDEDLPAMPAGSKVSNEMLITGIAAHDLYHAGQIQALKRLQPS